jgi:hypothetical protein
MILVTERKTEKRLMIVSESDYRNIVNNFPFTLAKKGLKISPPPKAKIIRYALMEESKVLGIVSLAASPDRVSLFLFDLEILPKYQKLGLDIDILKAVKTIAKRPISTELDSKELISLYKTVGFTVQWHAEDNLYLAYWIPSGFKG